MVEAFWSFLSCLIALLLLLLICMVFCICNRMYVMLFHFLFTCYFVLCWVDGTLRLDPRLAMVDVGWVTHGRLGDMWPLNEQRLTVGWQRHRSVGWATHDFWIGNGDR